MHSWGGCKIENLRRLKIPMNYCFRSVFMQIIHSPTIDMMTSNQDIKKHLIIHQIYQCTMVPPTQKGWVKNNTKTRAYCFRNKQRRKLQYITPKNTQSNLYGLKATSNLQKISPTVVYVSYHFLSILIVNWLQMQMLRDIKIRSSTSNMMASFKLIAKIWKELQNVFKILQG